MKSRWPLSIDNHGGFRLVDVHRNVVVVGERFDVTIWDIEDCLQ
jgi:hypothetical protein